MTNAVSINTETKTPSSCSISPMCWKWGCGEYNLAPSFFECVLCLWSVRVSDKDGNNVIKAFLKQQIWFWPLFHIGALCWKHTCLTRAEIVAIQEAVASKVPKDSQTIKYLIWLLTKLLGSWHCLLCSLLIQRPQFHKVGKVTRWSC